MTNRVLTRRLSRRSAVTWMPNRSGWEGTRIDGTCRGERRAAVVPLAADRMPAHRPDGKGNQR